MGKGDRFVSVVIRVAAEADIPGMHRVRVSVKENALSHPDRIRAGDYRAMILDDGRGWVCEADGEIVGFAVADLKRANVWALFISPEHEKRGIGRRLHDAMMDWMFEAVDLVWLGTAPNSRAEGFYLAVGWERIGLQPDGEVRFELSRERWRAKKLPG
jgi:GNAT superfamily N-acetyltransferase